MSGFSISNLSILQNLTTQLQNSHSKVAKLTSQLASEKKNEDLTEYSASDARTILNIQTAATEKQSYLNVIATSNNMLSAYDTTLTDLETLLTNAQNIVSANGSYSEDKASVVKNQADSYLRAITSDLNMKINGRFIYSGSRYLSQPVQADLSQLPTSTLSPTIYSDKTTVPSYDSASTISLETIGSSVTVTGATNGTSGSQTASFVLNGTTYDCAINTTDTTPALVAADICAQLNASGIVVSLDGLNPAQLNFDPGYTIGSAGVATANTNSYVTDKATIDTNYTLNYGVTSNDKAIQEMVAGMRYLQMAGSSTDETTYKAYLTQAQTLLNAALPDMQNLHTVVSNNISILSQEKTLLNSSLSSLKSQLKDVQGVDVTQVSTEMTSMEAILQASYSATGSILKMTITNYL
jgi:flagellin-like hook-associated protein FlgL